MQRILRPAPPLGFGYHGPSMNGGDGLPVGLRLGTSSFANDDWRGVFYPAGAKPGDYLRHYATQFWTVEIDAPPYESVMLDNETSSRSNESSTGLTLKQMNFL